MKRLLPLLFMGACLMALLSSCRETEPNLDVMLTDQFYGIRYTDDKLHQISATGGRRSANLYLSSQPIKWSLSSLPTWASCSRKSGTTGGNIDFQIAENPFLSSRVAVYYLTAELPSHRARLERSVSQKASTPYLSMTPTATLWVDYDTAPITLAIVSNVSWQLTCDQPDIATLSKTNGQGSDEVQVTLLPFDVIDSNTSRAINLTLQSNHSGYSYQQTLTIQQKTKGFQLNLTRLTADFPWKASSGRYQDLGKSLHFTTSTEQSWLTISPSSGEGELDVQVAAMPNASFTPRVGYAYVRDASGKSIYEFRVNQAAVECNLSATSLAFESDQTTPETLSLTTNAAWKVSTDVDWLRLSRSTLPEGTTTLQITASEWLSTYDRTATLTLTLTADPALTRSVSIRQYGARLVAEDAQLSFGPEGGQQTYSFTGNTSWTVRCSDNWMTATPSSGTGAGTLTISVERNPQAHSRVGYVYLSDDAHSYTITLTQASTELNIDVADMTFESNGGSKQLTISSNDAWTATCQASWLQVSPTSGTGNVQLTLTASTNQTATERTDTVWLMANGQRRSLTVRQKEPVIKPSVSRLSFFQTGGTQTISIESDVPVTATAGADWIRLEQSNRQLQVTVSENTTAATRTSYVRLSLYDGVVTQDITVTQVYGLMFVDYEGNETSLDAATDAQSIRFSDYSAADTSLDGQSDAQTIVFSEYTSSETSL